MFAGFLSKQQPCSLLYRNAVRGTAICIFVGFDKCMLLVCAIQLLLDQNNCLSKMYSIFNLKYSLIHSKTMGSHSIQLVRKQFGGERRNSSKS